KDHE
ncbi:hypothetical protein VCHC80A1_00197B, partial [Vibrio cholerae HC-80A1]